MRERRKPGFPTPTRIWLKGAIGDWAAGLMAGSGARSLLDLEYAQRPLAEHRAGAADHSRKVWTVAIFCPVRDLRGRHDPPGVDLSHRPAGAIIGS